MDDVIFSRDTSARHHDEIRDRKKGPPSRTKKGSVPHNFYSLVWREINEAVNDADIFPRSKLDDLVKKATLEICYFLNGFTRASVLRA